MVEMDNFLLVGKARYENTPMPKPITTSAGQCAPMTMREKATSSAINRPAQAIKSKRCFELGWVEVSQRMPSTAPAVSAWPDGIELMPVTGTPIRCSASEPITVTGRATEKNFFISGSSKAESKKHRKNKALRLPDPRSRAAKIAKAGQPRPKLVRNSQTTSWLIGCRCTATIHALLSSENCSRMPAQRSTKAIESNPRLSWTVGTSCCDEGNKALGSSAGCTEHPAPLCRPINIGAYSAN